MTKHNHLKNNKEEEDKKEKEENAGVGGNKYMTVTVGNDFRTIAKIMSNNSYKMNHATARNQTFIALHNLLLGFSKEIKGKKVKSKEMYEILQMPEVYDNLSEILFDSVKTELRDILGKENK